MTKFGGASTISCQLLCSDAQGGESVQRDAEALHFGETLESNAGKEGERISRLPFFILLARVEDERYLN